MAKNFKVSSTRISSFLSCKQKYWFNYYQKLPRVGNPAFKLGTTVHETLEFAGAIWIEKGKFSKADHKKIMDKYNEVSIQEGIEDLAIHAEGKTLVQKRLDNFMVGEQIIGLETKFGFWGKDSGPQITSKYGVPLIGAIDKVEKYDDETLLIIDYKTSKTAPNASQMRTDIQLSIYDLVARQVWPGYKRVICALDLLKHDVLYTYRTDEQREEFEVYLRAVYDEMLGLREEDVKASLNMFCPWCDFKDYCGTYKKACEKSDYNFLPTVNYSDDQLVSEWNTVKSTKKILESRERELNMIMMEKIRRNSANVVGDGKEVYVRQNAKVTYDLDAVHKVVPPEDFPELVNLNKRAVDMYMNVNPTIKEIVEETAVTNYTTPFLASKKAKE